MHRTSIRIDVCVLTLDGRLCVCVCLCVLAFLLGSWVVIQLVGAFDVIVVIDLITFHLFVIVLLCVCVNLVFQMDSSKRKTKNK